MLNRRFMAKIVVNYGTIDWIDMKSYVIVLGIIGLWIYGRILDPRRRDILKPKHFANFEIIQVLNIFKFDFSHAHASVLSTT